MFKSLKVFNLGDEKTTTYMCPNCFKLYHLKKPIPKSNIGSIEVKSTDTIGITCKEPIILNKLIWNPCCEFYNVESVDDDIADIIVEFNTKGFRTIYSCSGHWYDITKDRDDHSFGSFYYISFEKESFSKLFNYDKSLGSPYQIIFDSRRQKIQSITKYIYDKKEWRSMYDKSLDDLRNFVHAVK